jgi:aminoglycoside phosphotransferase family enzyme/predicted kinase
MPAKEASPVSREKLLAFLLEHRSYPHRPTRIRLIETHASYVLLAAPYAYKVKKAVNFGFLDFSTLEKRYYFSEREVMLNRRLCPGVYLGVVPISLRAGSLAFGPGGEIVEYAVKMRKLRGRYFMLRLLQNDKVGTEQLDRCVWRLKKFYEAQQPTDEVTSWGQIEKLKISTEENFRQMEAFIGFTISRPAFETIRLYTDDFYALNVELFESRIREEWIRDCHGDLHLEHIHIAPRRLSIFDCIEFNDRFRYIDVANDIAFLAMDLDYHGRPDLSRQFASRMGEALNDRRMLLLTDFYKCYRAYVRGKVESFHQNATGLPELARRESRERAGSYFRLALQYAVCGSESMVVIVMGRVGSGKSTLARSLGRELGSVVCSSDRTRKDLAGVPLYERSGGATRRRLYSAAMTKKTYEMLMYSAASQVKSGHSVVLDATFSDRQHRDQIVELLKSAGVRFYFVETQASEDARKRRLKERAGKFDEVSDARLEDSETLDRSYEVPELGKHGLVTVGTEGSEEMTVMEALKSLTRRPMKQEPE